MTGGEAWMEFVARVELYPGKPWRIVRIPDPPPATHPWGRTPVHAVVDGHRWETSTWRQKSGGALLLLPREVTALEGAEVTVELYPRALSDEPPTPRRRRRG